MTGFKKGTGSLDLSDDSDPDESDKQEDNEQSHHEDMSSEATQTATDTDLDMDNLPYLVERQMTGKSVNADRTKQLLLEVRPFVERKEGELLDNLDDRVDGPVNKGDVREAAMVVAQENPDLVADKLRDWGIDVLEK